MVQSYIQLFKVSESRLQQSTVDLKYFLMIDALNMCLCASGMPLPIKCFRMHFKSVTDLPEKCSTAAFVLNLHSLMNYL